MASVNKVTVLGNLGRAPEIKYLPSGDALANLAIATSYKTKDKNTGEAREVTEWHRVTLFGRIAELAGQYLTKGSSVYVEGRLQTRKYQKEGVDHYVTEIVGENIQFLDKRPAEGQAPAPAPRPAQQPKPTGTIQSQRPAGPGDMPWDDIDPQF